MGGALYAIAFPNPLNNGFYITHLIGMFLFVSALFELALELKRPLVKMILAGLAFSMGLNLIGYYWIPHTLKEFGQIPPPLNWLLGLFFTFIILPYLWPVVFVVYKLRGRLTNYLEKTSFMVFFSALFTLSESIVPQQFPGHLGHGFLNFAPYLGLAPIFGAKAFSFFGFLACTLVFQYRRYKTLAPVSSMIIVLFTLLNFLWPIEKKPTQGHFNLRIVQANIGNFMKLDSENGGTNSIAAVIKRYKDLSLGDPNFSPDLIVWPETAYPFAINSEKMQKDLWTVPPVMREIISKTQSELLFGGYDQLTFPPVPENPYFEAEFNSAILLGKKALTKEKYHKHLLIPFGETLPFGPLTELASRYLKNVSFFARGERFPTFELDNGIQFVTPICYEILYSSFIKGMIDLEKYPEFIVNLTNDSWYGDTAEPYQHLFLAKWRAIEFGIPIIRSTNTGITSIISSDLSESPRIGIGEQRFLDLKTPIEQTAPTLFAKYGATLWQALALLLFLLEVFWQKRKIRQDSKETPVSQ